MNIDESNIIDIRPNSIEEVLEFEIKNNALGGFVKPDKQMRVFKFEVDGYEYAIAAKTQEIAVAFLKSDCGISDEKYNVSEIDKSEWDKKIIEVYEDNDTSKKQFKISINEAIAGNEPQLVFTNDHSLVD